MSDGTDSCQDDPLRAMLAILADPNGGLTDEEREKYDAAREELVRARRHAERMAHTFWLGDARS